MFFIYSPWPQIVTLFSNKKNFKKVWQFGNIYPKGTIFGKKCDNLEKKCDNLKKVWQFKVMDCSRSFWSPWNSLTPRSLFRENIFKHRFKSPQSSNILIFAAFVNYYNRWHQSIRWNSIVILIKKSNSKKP